jgi:dihydroneopterin aldolase
MGVIIKIDSIRAFGRHGLSDEERSRPQPFEVDLNVRLADDEAIRSDNIEDTIDYDNIVSIAVDAVENTQCKLIEHLAGSIGRRILDGHRDRIESVSVTVRKLHPPMSYHVGSVGVCVEQR